MEFLGLAGFVLIIEELWCSAAWAHVYRSLLGLCLVGILGGSWWQSGLRSIPTLVAAVSAVWTLVDSLLQVDVDSLWPMADRRTSTFGGPGQWLVRCVTIAVVVGVGTWLSVKSNAEAVALAAESDFLAFYDASVHRNSTSTGGPQREPLLTVFSDYRCPACADAHRSVTMLAKRYNEAGGRGFGSNCEIFRLIRSATVR